MYEKVKQQIYLFEKLNLKNIEIDYVIITLTAFYFCVLLINWQTVPALKSFNSSRLITSDLSSKSDVPTPFPIGHRPKASTYCTVLLNYNIFDSQVPLTNSDCEIMYSE